MENLYHDFLIALQPMESPSQLFDVISKWKYFLRQAEESEKSPDTDVDDALFYKLKQCLRAEIETWELLANLYLERLNDGETRMEMSGGDTSDVYHIGETEAVHQHVHRSQALREIHTIIRWLEANYPARKDPPDLIEKFVNWEQTFETLKKDALLGRPSKHTMVRSIDPDAVIREKRHLHELDETDAAKAYLGCFYYLRVGDHQKAFSFLHESGNIAYAATLFGAEFTGKKEKDPDEIGESTPMQVIPPINRRVTHQRPDYVITGNVRRDTWKRSAFLICETNKQSKYERAALGALCGHRDAMLLAASSWEDQLWSYLKTTYDVALEKDLRSYGNARYVPMPSKYWDQFTELDQSINIVNSNFPAFKPALSSELIFREAQLICMRNAPESFLENYQNDILSFIELTEDHPHVLNHTIRFIVHLLIVYRICNYPVRTELMDHFVELYTEILVKFGHLVYLPFYVQQMTKGDQVPLIAQHVSSVTTKIAKVSSSDIELFLNTAQLNGIDPLEVGVEVVESLRAKDDSFSADNLEWISLAYNYVEDPKLVMLSLLRAVIHIARTHIRAGHTDKLKSYMKEVTPKCIDEVSAISDLYLATYVKEFSCYRLYLDAVDNYMRWITILCQEPQPQDIQQEGTLADRAIYDKRARDFRIRKTKWEENFSKLTEVNFDKFRSLLNYENGFLLNCSSEQNGPHEHFAIFETRRVILGNVVRYFMKLVDSRKNFTLYREFMKILTCSEKNIYRSISPEELQTVFTWSEKFVRSNSKGFARVPQ